MSSKRKREAKDDVGEAVGGKKEKGLLADFCFFLHPAALSKVRRSIFEKQISANRGRLLPKLEDVREEGGTVTVLIDDSLADRDKVRSIAEKVGRENPSVNIQCVGLSWLSKCLEEREVAPLEGFSIRSTPAAKPPKTSAGGSDGAADEQDDKDKPDDAEAPSSSSTKGAPSSYIERNKHKFVCARSSDNKLDENLNKHITDQLEKLAAAYKSSNDTWRAFGFQKAISALKNHPRKVDSREEATKIPNVGKKMADKIVEIVEEGSLRKVQEVCDNERIRTLDLFGRVWGAGPATAEKWYGQGLRTLEDLRLLPQESLSKHQQIGLRLFEDLDERMQREECTEILEQVTEVALKIQPGLEVIGCGSYRRGKATCGDLDVLITHQEEAVLDGLFEKMLSELRKIGFLTDDLTIQRDGRQQKYLGVCKLLKAGSKHRRLDIIVVPPDERACALLYFTGSAHFNRSMRLLATKMGMSLSEHSLVRNVVRGAGREKLNEGEAVPSAQERDVFEHLGLPYREPRERNH